MSAKSFAQNKKYELVAPDGGWGYMICLAVIINMLVTMGFVSSFGLIYNEFMTEVGMGSTAATFVNGINAICFALAGFFTNPLLKLLSLRKLAFWGVFCYNCGVMFMAFMDSVVSFYICQGVLKGAGLGLIYNLSFTILNQYFVKKRLFAMSIMQTIVAAFSMAVPMLVKYGLSNYGYRGTLLLISSLSIHTFIAVALMQPVAWHKKRIEVEPKPEELKVLLMKENSGSHVQIVKLAVAESLNDIKSHVECSTPSHDTEKSEIKKILREIFDTKTMKLMLLSNVSWGTALAVFIDLLYVLILPQSLYAVGWKEEQVAMALSVIGFGDLVARGAFIAFNKILVRICNQKLFILGLITAVISRTGILCTVNPTAIMILLTLLGISRCFVALLFPLVVSDSVGPERFTSAMGILLLIYGIMNLVLGTLFGVLRDYTDSYPITFSVLTAITSVTIVTWTIELYYKRKQKNVPKLPDI